LVGLTSEIIQFVSPVLRTSSTFNISGTAQHMAGENYITLLSFASSRHFFNSVSMNSGLRLSLVVSPDLLDAFLLFLFLFFLAALLQLLSALSRKNEINISCLYLKPFSKTKFIKIL
jgi:hypothetical protein